MIAALWITWIAITAATYACVYQGARVEARFRAAQEAQDA